MAEAGESIKISIGIEVQFQQVEQAKQAVDALYASLSKLRRMGVDIKTAFQQARPGVDELSQGLERMKEQVKDIGVNRASTEVKGFGRTLLSNVSSMHEFTSQLKRIAPSFESEVPKIRRLVAAAAEPLPAPGTRQFMTKVRRLARDLGEPVRTVKAKIMALRNIFSFIETGEIDTRTLASTSRILRTSRQEVRNLVNSWRRAGPETTQAIRGLAPAIQKAGMMTSGLIRDERVLGFVMSRMGYTTEQQRRDIEELGDILGLTGERMNRFRHLMFIALRAPRGTDVFKRAVQDLRAEFPELGRDVNSLISMLRRGTTSMEKHKKAVDEITARYQGMRVASRAWMASLGATGRVILQTTSRLYWFGLGIMFVTMSIQRMLRRQYAVLSRTRSLASAYKRLSDAQEEVRKTMMESGASSEEYKEAIGRVREAEYDLKIAIEANRNAIYDEMMSYLQLAFGAIPVVMNGIQMGITIRSMLRSAQLLNIVLHNQESLTLFKQTMTYRMLSAAVGEEAAMEMLNAEASAMAAAAKWMLVGAVTMAIGTFVYLGYVYEVTNRRMEETIKRSKELAREFSGHSLDTSALKAASAISILHRRTSKVGEALEKITSRNKDMISSFKEGEGIIRDYGHLFSGSGLAERVDRARRSLLEFRGVLPDIRRGPVLEVTGGREQVQVYAPISVTVSNRRDIDLIRQAIRDGLVEGIGRRGRIVG